MTKSEVKAKIDLEGMRSIILNALPQNITNGDVIKALFPNDSWGFLVVNMDKDDWRNAPYKGVDRNCGTHHTRQKGANE